ncbi:MAG: hydrogenase iron-sulfur subunit [Thermodesulfobacteriota bacterium]
MDKKQMKLCVFYCANCLDAEALRQVAVQSGTEELTTVSLPCSGKVNLLYLVKAFEKGADGVILVTCGQGDCHFLEGNLRAKKRAEAVDELLAEIGLGRGRMRLVRNQDPNGVQPIVDEIKHLKESIEGRR